MIPIEIGTGVLNWLSSERGSDRYGSVYLLKDGTQTTLDLKAPPSGETGQLIAEVIEPRETKHSDPLRGFFPETPKYNQVEILGTGSCFTNHVDGIQIVGVSPLDGRRTDWLDPRALYNVHNSLVRLLWRKITT